MRRIVFSLAVVVLGFGLAAAPRLLTSRIATSHDFVHFESAHVHPLDITPSRDRLLAVNTADNRLSVFDITGATPVRLAEIPVGLEPISVRALNDSVAWVVNQLSDNVSIVDLNIMHVRATVRTGDEPMDVVFAGSPTKAYVSVATEDMIKVYDPTTLSLDAAIPVNGRRPRALARNAAGTKVFVSIFDAGNRTTVLSPTEAPPDSMPFDFEFPRDGGLPTPPNIGLIVSQATFDLNWYDMWGGLRTSRVPFQMHEVDVAEITTATNTVTNKWGEIGSHHFAIDVNPFDGTIITASTLARNEQRFEPRLNGYLVETRLGRIRSGTVTTRIFNPHIDYFSLPGTQAELDSALGTPTGITFSGGGGRIYATSLANDRLGVLAPFGGAQSTVLARVPCVAGPTGVKDDSLRNRIYVLGRFHNQLQTLSSTDFTQIDLQGIGFDPTPDEIVNGRKFLYKGSTSGHGDQSCGTCHIFGDTDNVSWNLGDPAFGTFIPNSPPHEGWDPEKGPMMTQSLRSHINTGLLHWRADRIDFKAFNGAFVSLMGLTSVLPDSEMTAFQDFSTALVYPPNPYQNLDRSLPDAPLGEPSAVRGETFFTNFPTGAGGETCNDCHTATNFGSGTNSTFIPDDSLLHRAPEQDQDMKVPHLRNLYTKTGFRDTAGVTNKRGFGYGHDGSTDNLRNFLKEPGFDFGSTQAQQDSNLADVEAFLFAFDTGMAPAVGYQLTFDGTNNNDMTAIATLDTLIGQSEAGYCDLIAKGRIAGQPRGFFYRGANLWQSSKGSEVQLTTSSLRALGGTGSELTVMGVPAGSGRRMGIDRDRDDYLDTDEVDNASDPGDPASTPTLAGIGDGNQGFVMLGISPNPFRNAAEIRFQLGRRSTVDAVVYDIMGRQVRELSRGALLEAGPQMIRWDGRASGGRQAGPGVYFIRVKTDVATWNRPVVRLK